MAYPYIFQHDNSYIIDGAYCKPEDVQSLFKNIGAFSTLDATEITRRVTDAAVEIDRMIEGTYLTPVAGDAAALTVLRLINSRLAAAVIGEVYFRSSTPNVAPVIAQWRVFAELLIKDILDGVIYFFTAPVRPGGDLPQFPTGAGATFNRDNDADANPESAPLFQRGGRGNLASLGDIM